MQEIAIADVAVGTNKIDRKQKVIAVVGNPNCGKTTLFNALTGLNQRVGNWPGVTVDKKTGFFSHNNCNYELVDLPGIYSLSAASVDEKVARDYLLSGEADLIVNIVDASNPDRNLYLTSRLLEMRVPVIIVLNMIDVAKERGIEPNIEELSSLLGCRVVSLIAAQNQGIGELKQAIQEEAERKHIAGSRVIYPDALKKATSELAVAMNRHAVANKYDPDWFALKLLEGDHLLQQQLGKDEQALVEKRRELLAEELGDDADIAIADGHYSFIGEVSGKAIRRKEQSGTSLSERIDGIVLNRVLGIPIFLAVMYLMFFFTVNVGGAFIDFFDLAGAALFVDGFGTALKSIGASGWVVALLATGFGGALQTMATFIPPIGFMFIFLSVLEDSGYMARAAYVMDRGMRAIGLPGKAFIPLLVGFGCNVPAIMSTRTLSEERDRIMTIMMTPFMSCGARMPVYVLFAAAFFPAGGQNVVFLLYLIGIAVAIFTAFVLRATLLKSDVSPFIMEMPTYHLPTFKGIFIRVWDRLKSFLLRAGKVLIPIIMVLSIMNSIGADGTFGHEDSEESLLTITGKAISPVFSPFGVTEENWPATVGLFTGIFAKEAVIGTLNNLYSQMDRSASTEQASEGESPFNLGAALNEAIVTIPKKLSDLPGTVLDPLGISVGDVSDKNAVAEEKAVNASIFGSMARLFDGTAGAFAYLVFILLYVPCVAALAAVYRETNLSWTIFATLWTTGLAYVLAIIVYQTATLSTHPASSIGWITGMVLLLGGTITTMRLVGSGYVNPDSTI
ncbi:MAG: Fe(2+) transporter permease subunit FeoB [Chlorobiales bacterium]|nr:Fe(2+) transporter permease subunit FeoB [Chlorobiales bacterium]